MLNQNNNTTSPSESPIPTVKKELPKKNRLPMLFVLVLVVFVAFAGIGISLRQYLVRESVAPTAPGESQASVDKIQECSLSFDVAPPESGIECTKKAYRDELSNTEGEYELVQEQGSFTPGEIIVYSFVVTNTGEQTTTITASDRLNINIADDVYFSYEFLDSNCGDDAYQERRLTCIAEDLGAGESETFTFRIRLSDEIDMDMILSNEVVITDTDEVTDNRCSVDVNIEIPTSAVCNEACTSNDDCSQSGQSCINDVCRLTENPESETCQELALCNESCSANTDCSQSGQSCINDVCRLVDNPTSATCEPEVEAYCNETCESNSECVESGQSCINDVCRLVENPTSVTCEPEVVAYCGETCGSNADCVESNQTCYNSQCRLATNPTSINCQPPVVEPTPTPDTQAYCGEYCDTNSDCVNRDQICYFNECRLADYPDRQDCTIPQIVATPPVYVQPTPTVGCNETCLSNRDCSNDDHICYEDSCRLADYPASKSCTVPATTQPPQPKMPTELPKSGSDDLINWIKAGIGILGAGALLLLL